MSRPRRRGRPEHARAVRDVQGLPHRDSFAQLLATQALVEGVALVTADRALLWSRVRGLSRVDAGR